MGWVLKKISALIIAAASIGPVRKAARLLFGMIKMKRDLALKAGENTLYVSSPDRLLAALLWKYSPLSGLESSVYGARIKNGMTVLDIGANIGFFTLQFSKLAGERGRVLAFEPDPENFRLLSRNISANRGGNVECVNKAVSGGSGTTDLFISREHRGDHRLYDSGDGREAIKVATVSIDELLGPDGRADFIKIDVQGAEYPAILGMERTIRNSPGLTMLCEFSPSLLKKAGAAPEALLAKFRELGLTLKYLDEDERSVKEAGIPELLALCRGEKYINLLLEKRAPALT